VIISSCGKTCVGQFFPFEEKLGSHFWSERFYLFIYFIWGFGVGFYRGVSLGLVLHILKYYLFISFGEGFLEV